MHLDIQCFRPGAGEVARNFFRGFFLVESEVNPVALYQHIIILKLPLIDYAYHFVSSRRYLYIRTI